jgi:diguanylate cyclase (GGDEF)-like protein
MRARSTERIRAAGRLRALGIAIRRAQTTLSVLRRAVDAESVARMSVALAESSAENARLRAAGRVVTAEVESMHTALRHAVRTAEEDVLTRLSTRAVLWDRLSHDIATSERRGARLAVFFMDLDGFKAINDRLGHAVGDLVLQHVATRLRLVVRAGDTLCRIGGDEFVLVCCDATRTDIGALLDKIHETLAAPCMVDGDALVVSASIGASTYPEDGDDAGMLVRKADAAMYAAKRASRLALIVD